jgi:hypothetical protein
VIKHPQFIARYSEIDRVTEKKVGDQVKEGQVIAYVGDQAGDDMLHIEFFTGKLKADMSYKPGTHPPYDRRDDVFDGVKFLDSTRQTATFFNWVDTWRYVTNADGQKFLDKMGSARHLRVRRMRSSPSRNFTKNKRFWSSQEVEHDA